MTSWTRILQSPATRRISSSFSSKAGNGRYFNSAKPLSAPASPKKSTTVDTDSGSNGPEKQAAKTVDGSAVVSSSSRREILTRPAVAEFVPSTHPVVGDKDFKLHQFFSLDRPLLLLSNPQSILYSSPPTSLFSLSSTPPPPPALPHEASPEAAAVSDAEAARTLARAIALNRAGATCVWEETLKWVGLDVNLEPGRAGLQERLDKELQDVKMDSVRRKRRKKMKKHKLKKRRRLTRASRIKTR